MPRFDGTGPMGYGQMTGRGFGDCYTSRPSLRVRRVPRFGRGCGNFGFGRGYGRGFAYGYRAFSEYSIPAKARRQWLIEQKELLKQELDYVSDQLDNIVEEE